MRPIKLKIKGINSFIEEQTIDFEKLTQSGFFGIFGPTGSGKSTILDGITLALYGKVARSSSNYINTNCDSGSVSFEFEISGAMPKRYFVSREFKTDKKTGNPRSGKCKVVDITNKEAEEILAESTTTVEATCKEIIGLNLEDFTRTVVLPQGKFSEFLKLEGKSRREMLERLFNLQKYGDDLARKLGREISKERTENSVLLGELKGYEEVSEEAKKEKQNILNESKEELKKISDDLEEVKKLFAESEHIWNLQLELQDEKKKKAILESKDSEILQKKNEMDLAEAAERVAPYVTEYEGTIEKLSEVDGKLTELKHKLKVLNEEKEVAKAQWNLANNEKSEKIPSLKVKEQEIRNAIDEKILVDGIGKEIEKLNTDIKATIIEIEKLKLQIIQLDNDEKKLIEDIKTSEQTLETLKVDPEFRALIQQGDKYQSEAMIYYHKEQELLTKIENTNNIIRTERENEAKIRTSLEKRKNFLQEKETTLKELEVKNPGDSNELIKLNDLINVSKEKWTKYKNSTNEINKIKNNIEVDSAKLEKYKEEKSIIDRTVEEIKLKIKEQERENLAHRLREALIDGDICPVCGAKDHHKENIKDIQLQDISGLEAELKSKESDEKNIGITIVKLGTSIEHFKDRITEIDIEIVNLGEEFKKLSVEDLQSKFNDLKKAIDDYNSYKEKTESEIKILKDEIGKLEMMLTKSQTIIDNNKTQLETLEEDKKSNGQLLEDLKKKINELRVETDIHNFSKELNKIKETEKNSNELTLKIKGYRSALDNCQKGKTLMDDKLKLLNEKEVADKVSLKEKISNRDEKIQSINRKVQDINNIEVELTAVVNLIKEIEDKFNKCEKDKLNSEELHKECNDEVIKYTAESNQLNKKLVTDKERLDQSLKVENFASKEEVKEKQLGRDVISGLKIEINNHNDEKSKVSGAIGNITGRLQGRSISEENWIEIQNIKREKELVFEATNKVVIELEQELRDINKKLQDLGSLLKKKEKVEKKLGLLGDLEKLFKGKKFVEFVAASRLKYVSIEASKRLKEITNGNYGLEVDEDGKFIIRDYKNGGAGRDASTLSGGETFVASLALALALSAEIQLKGTAPLELFFLDEGFGTLDDNLLEVVMSSLERIHNDKLKIGLISHVESIKNRVPVKLILTAAEAGMGGSKVKIEKS